MKKKGFTLVELLATIALLSLVLIIGTTSVTKIIKDNKTKAYNVQIQAFLDDVRTWALDNSSKLPNSTKIYMISLGDLINDSYATAGTINPLTGNEFSPLTSFCVINNDGNYTYNLDEGDACGKTTITYSIDPTSLQNGYSYTTTANVDFSNVIELNYYIKSSHTATSDEPLVSSCGTATDPATCNTIPSTTTLTSGTWYKVNDDVKVSYTESDNKNESIYAVTNDGSTFSSIVTGNINLIDRTKPTVVLSTPTSTTNSISIPVTMTDDESGIASYTCKYGTSNGNYTSTSMSGNGSLSKCTINYRLKNTVYYYQVCATDKVGNTGCTTGNTSTLDIANPTFTYTNNPTTIVNGYAKSQSIAVHFDSTNVTSPYYFIKTTRAGTASNTVSSSCGTATNPGDCSSIAGTTALQANIWYKVDGDISMSYTGNTNTADTLYAVTYDSVNFSSAATGAISKMDNTAPTISNSVSGASVTLNMTDANSGVSYYCVNTTNTVSGCTWTGITNSTNTSATYTATTAATFYSFSKDAVGNISASTSYTIPASALHVYSLGQAWGYDYNGGVQGFTVTDTGVYKLEVYGAAGGAAYMYRYDRDGRGGSYASGGEGGYSSGYVFLNKGTTLYIVVGGVGSDGSSTSGTGYTVSANAGFNGGAGFGGGNQGWEGGAGGGATHIAVTNRGVLSSYGSYQGEVLIVAGGGGGGQAYRGGDRNQDSLSSSGFNGGGPGNLNPERIGASGSFGQGASANGSGSGGGGWIGGSAGNMSGGTSCGGGGGSGYIGGVPSFTYNGTTFSPSTSYGGRSGNGYARITLMMYQ